MLWNKIKAMFVEGEGEPLPEGWLVELVVSGVGGGSHDIYMMKADNISVSAAVFKNHGNRISFVGFDSSTGSGEAKAVLRRRWVGFMQVENACRTAEEEKLNNLILKGE